MSLTLVKLLWCGQGMTNLVEVYDDGDEQEPADFLALVDCGGSSDWGATAVGEIAMQVLARTPPFLDCLVISHQDRDHNNLLRLLGDKLKKKAKVGSVFLGGMEWTKRNRANVNYFLSCVGYDHKKVHWLEQYRSDYTKAKSWAELTSIAAHDDVHLRILCSNLPVAKATQDIVRNASSAVVVVDNKDYAVVLPGDATYQTMSRINGIKNLKTVPLLPTVLGLEIPHHGALRTAVENYVASGSPNDFDWKIIKKFAATIKAQHVGASAGPYNRHHHPVFEVLSEFRPNATAAAHTYAAYVFEGTEGWTTLDSRSPTECTIRALKGRAKVKPGVKKGRHSQGEFSYGDIVLKLAPKGVLRPEEMVEFRPLGTVTMPGADEVVYAPEP